MFDTLSDRLDKVFTSLRGKGRLSEADIDATAREIRIALLEADVALPVVKAFIASVKERARSAEVSQALNPAQQVIKIVNEELVGILGGETRLLRYAKTAPTVIMLAGLQGAGKTTLAGKLARHLKAQGHAPLLVACDLQRPNAVQQLQVVGGQAGVDVYAPYPGSGIGDPVDAARTGVEQARRMNYDVVVVDTAGRLGIDAELMQQAADIRDAVRPDEVLFVVDAMIGQDAVVTAQAFQEGVGFTGVVLTKLDGDARGGAALSVRHLTGQPILFASTGEKLADFDVFHPERMASRILGMGDVLSLIESAEKHFDQASAERMAGKLQSGADFDLEDFLEQMLQVRKMGPIANLLGMLPGMGQMKDALAQVDDRDIDRIAAIIQSMTPQERHTPKVLNGSRRLRIAKGSGVTVPEVNNLVDRFYEAQKMMKQMGGMGLPGVGRAAKRAGSSGKKGKKKGPGRAGGPRPVAQQPSSSSSPQLPTSFPQLPPGAPNPLGLPRPGSNGPDPLGLRRPAERSAPAIAAGVAAVLALAGVLGPPTGGDLVNALAREHFARTAGLTPVDLSQYGGTVQFGYSLLSQYVCALVGSRTATALATVAGAYAFALLLRGTRRQVLGGVAGAVCLAGDLLTGRTAFALGLAVALPALLAVRAGRLAVAGLLALLAAALSPVAGLFVVLAAAALALSGRPRAGLALAAGVALPLALTGVVFGEGGDAMVRWYDVWTGSVLALAVLAAAPQRALRVGAGLQVLGLLAALVAVPSIGHNADRLTVLLAAPLVLALAPWRPVVVALVAVGLVVLRPPLSVTDLDRIGTPALTAAFSAPVADELRRLAPTGRVEAVPLREHAESLYVAQVAPLARGWLRQLDTGRAAVFYDGTLAPDTYRAFLDDNAVQYVAVADVKHDGAGRDEARLVQGGLPYLTRVWAGGAWTLYAVADPTPLAQGAQLLRSTATEVAVRVDAPGDVLLRVRPSRWLTLSGPGCLAPAGRWLRLRAGAPGTYVVSSRLQLRESAAC